MKSILDLEGDVLGIRSSSVIKDVIYRTGSYLEKECCDETIVNSIYKMAQIPSLDKIPTGSDMPPSKEDNNGGSSAENGKKALDEFIENVRGYSSEDMTPKGIEEKFDKIKEEHLGVNPKKAKASWYNFKTQELGELEKVADKIYSVMKLISFANRKDKIKTAQEMPIAPEIPGIESSPSILEKKEDLLDKSKEEKPSLGNKTKKDINELFDDIKVSDITTRLEALSKVFQNREIARQLNIIDLMLDSLGLAGFFPSLAEATKSALESNQYCQSRVEEILSRLLSSTDENGDSLIDSNKLTPKKRTHNLIDKEMEKYLTDEIPKAEAEPKPVEEKAEEAVIPKPVEPISPKTPERKIPIAPIV